MAADGSKPAPKAGRKVAVPEPARQPVAQAGTVPAPVSPAQAASPGPAREPLQEPVWLVRFVLVLFLVGFAAFLAREVERFRAALP